MKPVTMLLLILRKMCVSHLLKEGDCTVILIDKPNILFVIESSMDVDDIKLYCVLTTNHLFMDYLYHVIIDVTNRCADRAHSSTLEVSLLTLSSG